MEKNESYWQDIFDTVDMKFLPVNYMNSIEVEFVDGEIWEIDLDQQSDETPVDEVLDDFFSEYEDTIKEVNFKMNFEKIKYDISKRTTKFLKHNK
jgi:hypothetical protein